MTPSKGILKFHDEYKEKYREEYIEYIKLNDYKNVYFFIEEKDVKFYNVVKVINYKECNIKNVTIKENPEVIYFMDSDNKIITYISNIKYELKCYFRYHYNSLIEFLTSNLITY